MSLLSHSFGRTASLQQLFFIAETTCTASQYKCPDSGSCIDRAASVCDAFCDCAGCADESSCGPYRKHFRTVPYSPEKDAFLGHLFDPKLGMKEMKVEHWNLFPESKANVEVCFSIYQNRLWNVALSPTAPCVKIHVRTFDAAAPALLGTDYRLHSLTDGRPNYVQVSLTNVVFLRHDNSSGKWVFSSRLEGGTTYAETASTSSASLLQDVTLDWRLQNGSTISLGFACSGWCELCIKGHCVQCKRNICERE